MIKQNHSVNVPSRLRELLLPFQLIALVALVVAFALVPPGASPIVIWPTLVLFYVSFWLAVRRPIHIRPMLPTFVTAEVLFLLFFYIIFFFPYQMYVLGLGDLSNSVFVRNTFVDQSNRAVIIAAIGLLGFCIGVRPRRRRVRSVSRLESSPARSLHPYLAAIIFMCQAVLVSIYLAAGWHSAGEGRYTGDTNGGTLAEGAALLILMFSMISTALFVARLVRHERPSAALWASIALSALWGMRILIAGDRNSFLLLAIVGIGGLLTYRIKAGRWLLAGCVLVGLVLYNAIEIVRMSASVSVPDLWHAVVNPPPATEGADSSSFNITTITLRSSLYAVPGTYDFGFGWYKLVGFAGIFPMIRGLVVGGDHPFVGTSQLFSHEMLGPTATWGVGSNIISDIYVDFGIIGVPVVMYLLGRFCEWIRGKAEQEPDSIRAVVMYLMTLALFAELPRYTVDFPVRMIVWTAFLLWVSRLVSTPSERHALAAPRLSPSAGGLPSPPSHATPRTKGV